MCNHRTWRHGRRPRRRSPRYPTIQTACQRELLVQTALLHLTPGETQQRPSTDDECWTVSIIYPWSYFCAHYSLYHGRRFGSIVVHCVCLSASCNHDVTSISPFCMLHHSCESVYFRCARISCALCAYVSAPASRSGQAATVPVGLTYSHTTSKLYHLHCASRSHSTATPYANITKPN